MCIIGVGGGWIYYINHSFNENTSIKSKSISGFETSTCNSNDECNFGFVCDTLSLTCKKNIGMNCKSALECASINNSLMTCNTICDFQSKLDFNTNSSCPCASGYSCIGGQCKISNSDTPCNENSDCASGICSGTCQTFKNENFNKFTCSQIEECPYGTTCFENNICLTTGKGLLEDCSNINVCSDFLQCSDKQKCVSVPLSDICGVGFGNYNGTCVSYFDKNSPFCSNYNGQEILCSSGNCSNEQGVLSTVGFIDKNGDITNEITKGIVSFEFQDIPTGIHFNLPNISRLNCKTRKNINGITTSYIMYLDTENNIWLQINTLFSNSNTPIENSIILTSSFNQNNKVIDFCNINYDSNYILILSENTINNILEIFVLDIFSGKMILIADLQDISYTNISGITDEYFCCWNSVNGSIIIYDYQSKSFQNSEITSELLPYYYYPSQNSITYVNNSKIYFNNDYFDFSKISVPNYPSTQIINYCIVYDPITLTIKCNTVCKEDLMYISLREINLIENRDDILEVNIGNSAITSIGMSTSWFFFYSPFTC